jgi:hypothetical protein
MRLRWLQEIVRNNIVNIRHIATGDNIADIFTKNLPSRPHQHFRAILMGHATIAIALTVAYGT